MNPRSNAAFVGTALFARHLGPILGNHVLLAVLGVDANWGKLRANDDPVLIYELKNAPEVNLWLPLFHPYLVYQTLPLSFPSPRAIA